MNRSIAIKKDPENEIPVEIFEQSIVDIAGAMKKLNASRLNRDTVVTLIHRHTVGISRMQINNVLDNLSALEKKCLK